jgi:hypothetical protein
VRVHRQFLAAQGIGQVADAITTLVVADAVLGGSGEGVLPSKLLGTLGAATLPYLVAGPLGGVVADRWDRRRMLFAVNLARAGVTLLALLAVLWGNHLLGLAAVAALLGAARFVYNLRAAALPHTAGPGRLVALDAAALRVGAFAIATGGGLAAATGGRSPLTLLAVAAALQIASAIAFVTVGCDLGGRAAAPRAGAATLGDASRRFGALLLGAPTRLAIVVTSTHRVLLGAAFATFVLIASNDYHLGPRGYVVAMAVTGFGSMLGTLTAARWHAVAGIRLVPVAFAGPALVLGATDAVRFEAYTIVALAAAFFMFQNLRIVADALVQSSIADDVRARVFSIYDALYNVSYFGGAAVAVSLSGTSSRPGLLVWIGAAYLGLAIVLVRWARLSGIQRTAAPLRVRPSLVRSTP